MRPCSGLLILLTISGYQALTLSKSVSLETPIDCGVKGTSSLKACKALGSSKILRLRASCTYIFQKSEARLYNYCSMDSPSKPVSLCNSDILSSIYSIDCSGISINCERSSPPKMQDDTSYAVISSFSIVFTISFILAVEIPKFREPVDIIEFPCNSGNISFIFVSRRYLRSSEAFEIPDRLLVLLQ